jgi:hypothetical protein
MEHEKWWIDETAKCALCGSVVVSWKCWKKGSSLEAVVIEMELGTATPDFFLCDKCYEDAMVMHPIEWELFKFEFAERV